MKLLTKVDTIFSRIVDILAYLAGVLLIGTMLIIVYEIVMRYFFIRPTKWVVNTAGFALLWITLLGATWVLKRERHVVIDVVIGRLNPRTRALLVIITSIVGAIVCLIVAWYTGLTTWDHFLRGTHVLGGIYYPKAPILMVIPVSMFLLFIQFLKRAYVNYCGVKRGL